MGQLSTWIPFEGMDNFRDIGGMNAADGSRIKKGLLYRSGYLKKATKRDVAKLDTMEIRKIIDFRAYRETVEKADPEIKGAVHLHIPAESEAVIGIVRDEGTDKSFSQLLIERTIDDPEFAINYMKGMYGRFVSSDYTTGQYARFVKEVRETDGAVIWHCTAGKDRAGFASIIIEEILGVHRDDIIEDYLKTNDYIKNEVDALVEHFRALAPEQYPEEAVRIFFSTREEYINSIYENAEKNYGSFENFMREALGVDECTKEQFREKYLL